MSNGQQKYFNDILISGRDLVNNIITIFFDLILLSCWAAAQYLFQVVKPDSSSNFEEYTIIVFQILFFLSTLIPVMLCIYKHIRIMINRTSKEIEETL